MNDHFSLGVGISHGSISSESFFAREFSLTRTNLGIRGLFHFGNNPKLDHYSGVRLGVSVSNFEGDFEDETGGEFQPRVFYGMRSYFNDDIGVNLEVGVGLPYFFNGGVVFRIK